MSCRSALLLISTAALAMLAAQAAPQPADDKKPDEAVFSKQIAPILAKYCIGCHGGAEPKAELAFDKFKDDASALKEPKVWERVGKIIQSREMPPKDKPKPTAAEYAVITSWIDKQFAQRDTGPRNPGRVTIRRLNRAEYNNTIRDLIGVSFQPADDFPSDDVGYGFDNIGDVLSMPPILLEKYLAAAEKIVAQAFATPAIRNRLVFGDDARAILERFASRAYRRPVKETELARLLSLVSLAEKNGDGLDKGLQLAFQAVLVSPHFLFRVELDPTPDDPDQVRVLNDFELATRLSYFLWSSMPDEELFALARQNALRKNGSLEVQVKRMLQDSKARALVDNFAGQWLQLRNLKSATPDPKLFPTFSEALRSAMVTETEMFFETIVKEDRSVLEFLDADFIFVNEPLAKHYGIPDVAGLEFQRVDLTDGRRGGLLTQASILTVTSNPTRTSPVKRGKFILENILGTPPPPPPPEVPELSEDRRVVNAESLRKRLEQHRADPNCAVCHERMDPLGFAFENYDAIGAWRTGEGRDGKLAIDPAGTLPGGESFSGPAELKSLLKKRDGEFRRCLTEKLLTFALGRGLETYDNVTVDEIARAVADKGNRFSALVLQIVSSDPFQKRKGKAR